MAPHRPARASAYEMRFSAAGYSTPHVDPIVVRRCSTILAAMGASASMHALIEGVR